MHHALPNDGMAEEKFVVEKMCYRWKKLLKSFYDSFSFFRLLGERLRLSKKIFFIRFVEYIFLSPF
jgi:hypothetical protein